MGVTAAHTRCTHGPKGGRFKWGRARVGTTPGARMRLTISATMRASATMRVRVRAGLSRPRRGGADPGHGHGQDRLVETHVGYCHGMDRAIGTHGATAVPGRGRGKSQGRSLGEMSWCTQRSDMWPGA